MRMAGREVFFMTGTDEHGEKIEASTLQAGFKQGEEKNFVDGIVPVFKGLWAKLGIRYDYFIRTTDAGHEACVRALLEKLYKEGRIYKNPYKGWFCTPCETFWSESQAPGGTCPDCKRPTEKLDEENYFLKMSEYRDWLIGHISSHPDFIRPDFRRNEVLGFLNAEPLLDLCISRPKSRMAWGIELPFDSGFVAYVWVDALINYISGAGYPNDMKRFARLWPCDVHVIGKDILRHHAVYWPIMLHAAGIEPPRSIFAHGWWVIKGEKMSKSKGNVVDPAEMALRYGVDAYRYFLLREVPFGLDGQFSEEAFVARYNSDLANDLGNLLNRTLAMTAKYFGGKVPGFSVQRTAYSVQRENLKAKTIDLASELEKAMPEFNFAAALTKIWEVINMANKFIEDSKPWALAKEKKVDELAAVILTLLETLRIVAIAISPVMPSTAKSIYSQLGLSEDPEKAALSGMRKYPALKDGSQVLTPTPLFPRIEIKYP
jgi:methionyl-tRNA synthetase